jgi:TPP-dependent 2-oxoacid decarboxylase
MIDDSITLDYELDEYDKEGLYHFPEINELEENVKNIKDVDEMINEVRNMRMHLKEINKTTKELDSLTPNSLIKNKPKLKEIPHKVIYNTKEYNLDIILNKQKNKDYVKIQDQLFEQELKLKEKSQNIVIHDDKTNRMLNMIHKTDEELDDLDQEIDDLIKLGEEINNYIEKIV